MADRPRIRATLIFNPVAGGPLKGSGAETAGAVLTDAGWDIRAEPTSGPGDATRLARVAAERGDDAVVVAGGDGTINEAVQGLARTETALGVIPMGSVNVWAREIRLPLSARGAATALVDGEWRRTDLGEVDGRFFLLMAGVGFDGAVIEGVGPRLKRALGVGAYLAVAARKGLGYRGVDVTLEMDSETVQCRSTLVVVSNTRMYGGVVVMSPEAVADDGLFDVAVFPGRRVWQSLPPQASAILLRQHDLSGARFYQTSHLRIISDDRLPVQIDGEHADISVLNFSVAPSALRVIVPRASRTAIFSDAEPDSAGRA